MDDAAVLHDLDLHIAVAVVLLGDVEHHHPLGGAGALADGEHDLRAGLHLGALLDALADDGALGLIAELVLMLAHGQAQGLRLLEQRGAAGIVDHAWSRNWAR